ncbi:diguanylate phosphodiesterase [Photobacterium kishitanii]|uniref:cyclic-guanylate-specific phosphodiesterase n=1 Tax=Photobacterium kishitanii TaxID=318456 RepID=A0AAX0YXA6_9GAMM|nr:cyclic diguanylate phosphodiesterase [Photobacterium kishitanii]KJG59910.1 diguanylate phosphodiesterase [Photobacterium kishitanii]KJG63191.1 diguanylate phosphodiesterase [Photobacterium kishitanii]KJG67799.1 diguanylate phosphodiesterase [Photobacterium kishitanii]KJG71363.1 diguanylate phosphodiesterase [Photobacterium kishitanii]PSX20293.1 cyclic diguanylate phosphodiesterase [Photobacterium kishitanii]
MKGKIKNILIIFLTFLPCVVILELFHTGFVFSLDRQAKHHAIEVVKEIDSILDYGEESNKQALNLISNDHSCSKVYAEIRTIVARIPYVRTTNLAHDDKVYCTSLWGPRELHYDSMKYISGKLRLMPGSEVEVKYPLIVVRTKIGKNVALSGIDGRYIKQLFSKQKSNPFVISLAIGDAWLTDNNKFTYNNPNKLFLAVQRAKSKTYPFTVYSGFNSSSSWLAFWQGELFYILVILLAQILFSIFCWWQLNRPRPLYLELERAIRKKEFVPYAQPIVDAITKETIGIEILMRWKHPFQGIVRPDLFIPQAEDSGLIIPMTDLLLKETAKQLREYKHDLPTPFHVGVNISPQHCKSSILLDECKVFIDEVSNHNVILVLELTERGALEVSEFTRGLFYDLKMLGCKIAIDDFGTGHSSLVNLQEINLDYLKIDRVFVKNIGVDCTSEHLIESTVELAKRLSLRIIAEGVETEAQAEYLKKQGIENLQGFLFAKPIPLGEFLQNYNQNISVIDSD